MTLSLRNFRLVSVFGCPTTCAGGLGCSFGCTLWENHYPGAWAPWSARTAMVSDQFMSIKRNPLDLKVGSKGSWKPEDNPDHLNYMSPTIGLVIIDFSLFRTKHFEDLQGDRHRPPISSLAFGRVSDHSKCDELRVQLLGASHKQDTAPAQTDQIPVGSLRQHSGLSPDDREGERGVHGK